jgi:hypothetical protein
LNNILLIHIIYSILIGIWILVWLRRIGIVCVERFFLLFKLFMLSNKWSNLGLFHFLKSLVIRIIISYWTSLILLSSILRLIFMWSIFPFWKILRRIYWINFSVGERVDFWLPHRRSCLICLSSILWLVRLRRIGIVCVVIFFLLFKLFILSSKWSNLGLFYVLKNLVARVICLSKWTRSCLICLSSILWLR